MKVFAYSALLDGALNIQETSGIVVAESGAEASEKVKAMFRDDPKWYGTCANTLCIREITDFLNKPIEVKDIVMMLLSVNRLED